MDHSDGQMARPITFHQARPPLARLFLIALFSADGYRIIERASGFGKLHSACQATSLEDQRFLTGQSPLGELN